MGAVLPLQHTLTLPHMARELLGNWLLLILSKMLNVSIFFIKGRNSEKCSFLVSLLLRGGTWILGNGIQQAVTDWRAVPGPGTCPNACCQLCCAWYQLFQCQPGFPPLLSFSPPSAPCISCTLGVMLWKNMFVWHWDLNEHPKTSVCGVSAPLTSAEIWHGSFCPTLLPQNKHKHLSTCRIPDEDIGALNLLLGFTVLFSFFLMPLLLFFWRQ